MKGLKGKSRGSVTYTTKLVVTKQYSCVLTVIAIIANILQLLQYILYRHPVLQLILTPEHNIAVNIGGKYFFQ